MSDSGTVKSREGSPENDLAYRVGKYIRKYPIKSAVLTFGGILLLVKIFSYEEQVDPKFRCLSKLDGSMTDLVWEVKRNARNPDSFEHIESSATAIDAEGHQHIRMKFRAQNGFGGMSIDTAEAIVSNPGCKLISWSIL